MTRIRTIAIDDEPIALEKLTAYIEKVPSLELVGAYESALEASQSISDGLVDLIITDIDMPDFDGIDFMRSLLRPPLVIFITAHDRYAVESYRLSAVDYLLKPYSFTDFQRAINKAQTIIELREQTRHSHAASEGTNAESDSLFVKTDYKYVRVSLSDIRYIKGYGEYLQIYLMGSSNPLLTLSSFANIMDRLPGNFMQVHRSYIVNMNHIRQIERNRIIMDAETSIPVGESYRSEFQTYITTRGVGRK